MLSGTSETTTPAQALLVSSALPLLYIGAFIATRFLSPLALQECAVVITIPIMVFEIRRLI
jgi:hypothetical protein